MMTDSELHEEVVGAAGAGHQLRLEGVTHRYRSTGRDVVALEQIDLDVDAGEFVCIIGPSGCGKSTLLEVVAGLREPTEGRILLGSRRVVGPSRNRGMVFQQSSSLYPWLTVRGNVELGLRIQGLPHKQRRARSAAEIERVGLSAFTESRPYELSGGMQQRCQIARALANDPELLLLDEPFGALDALTRESLQQELRQIWLNTGRTVVFVTHSVEEAVLLGSRVILMSPRPGRIVLDRNFPYAHSGRAVADLRSDEQFVGDCHELRLAIIERHH